MKHPAVKYAPALLLTLLLLSVSIISTFGEFAPGQLGNTFHLELGVSISLAGMLTSVIFASSGVASVLAGWIADRVAPKVLLPIQFILSALAFGSFAFAQSEAMLIASAVAIGVTMALMNPVSNRIITLYAPRSAFAQIMGWKSVGPQVGGVIAGLTLGGFTNLIDWRLVVLVLSCVMAIPAVWAFIVLRRYGVYDAPAPARAQVEDAAASSKAVAAPAKDVADVDAAPVKTRPIVWWLMPYLVFSSGVVGSMAAYLPLFATREIGLSAATGGAAVSVIAGVSVAMRFVWIRFLTPRRAVPLLVLAGVLTIFSSLVLVIAPAFGPWAFWLGVILIGATAMGATPLPQIVLVQNANPARIGMVSAWSTIAAMVGFTLQPWIVSVLVDQHGFAVAWLAITVCGFAAAATMVVYALTRRSRRQTQE